MRNSAYNLLKLIKHASAMGSGSFLPPEPLPNSVKANQLEQQELAQRQGEANAGAGNEQLAQMQKAQEAAVNELQQTKQQLAQAQTDLQNAQAQAQQQQQAAQTQAQQEIQKAQMDAQYELQSEKIKNQQQLLSVQEKYMRAAGKQKPDQNHILGNQLKRIVKKINNLKVASSNPATPLNPTGGLRDSVVQNKDTNVLNSEKKYDGLPYASVLPSQRTQQQWNEISDWKRNRIAQDPKMQAIRSQVMSTPNKLPTYMESSVQSFKDYLDNPWQSFETAKDTAFGAYDESKGIMENIKSNPLGSMGRAASNVFLGYVPSFVGGGVEAAKGLYHGDFSRAAKGVGTGLLGVGEGLLTYGTLGAGGAITKGLQTPGRLLAQGASKVLPATLAKPFQWGATKGLANLATQIPVMGAVYAGADKLGLGDPNMYKEQEEDYQDMNSGDSYMPYSGGNSSRGYEAGGFAAPQSQQRWDTGLSPSERFQVLNQAQMPYINKGASTDMPEDVLKQTEYPDIREFMKNPPPPGEYISSPIPIWQSGFKQHDIKMLPQSNRQSYGKVGDLLKDIIFNLGLPYFGIRNPFQPDFSKLYSSLSNNEAYKLKVPQTFNYY